MKSFARVALAVLAWLALDRAAAQTGPAPPRMVDAALPKGPEPDSATPAPDIPLTVHVLLSVDAAGRVTDVQVRESFGDAAFDQRVRDYYRQLRLVPALDARGIPAAGTVESIYTVLRGVVSRATFPVADVVFREPVFPTHDLAAGRATAGREVLYDERARISRMTCADFLWEYDFMKQLVTDAGEHALDDERPMSTAVFMFSLKYELPGTQLAWLTQHRLTIIVLTVERCRANPGAKYWAGVVEPTLKSLLPK